MKTCRSEPSVISSVSGARLDLGGAELLLCRNIRALSAQQQFIYPDVAAFIYMYVSDIHWWSGRTSWTRAIGRPWQTSEYPGVAGATATYAGPGRAPR
jgi:hypothetical protein